MSAGAALREAHVTQVLLVDDDLATAVTLAGLDAQAGVGDVLPSAILADPEHDFTGELEALLAAHGLPSGTAIERLAGLADPAMLARAAPYLRNAYLRASQQRADQKIPLDKIKGWIQADGSITLEEWTTAKVLPGADRYDLLVVDYYLGDNDPTATIKLINRFKEAHATQPLPLLVILMSSNIADIERDFETIRDQCQMSASRFRILAKPMTSNADGDEVVKEKWFRALRQLANERAIVAPIETFVKAWERSLHDAATHLIQRLYDMDASAFALLAATARKDSMTIEEYLADVLARRISAATEEKSFPFNEIAALETALDDAKSVIGPNIDQGVEVRHAQRAIRGLMGDVVWHRPPWWRPRSLAPELTASATTPAADVAQASSAKPATGSPPTAAANAPVVEVAATPAAASEAGSVLVEAAIAEPAPLATLPAEPVATAASATRTDARLKWLKRTVRFGTVLRERSGKQRYFVNLTQVCDVQSEKLTNVGEVNYLFMQGARIPVDKVAIGEKSFDSPYYREDSESDVFYTLQWRLRQPFTPSIGNLLDSLEDYEVVGQLRSESAYAVLAKYMSQAARVAQVRMPKVYRYAVSVYHKQADGSWRVQALASAIEASAWQKDNDTWRLQFTVDAAMALLPYLSGVVEARKESFVSALTTGLKVENKDGDLHAKDIEQTTALLLRVDGKADYDTDNLPARIAAVDKCKRAHTDATVIVTRALT